MSTSAEEIPSDPVAIVQQLQALTDIEGDLADTALAVVEQEQEEAHPETQIQTEQIGLDETITAAEPANSLQPEQDTTTSTDAGALLDSAEAIETVLESAIPAAPSHADPTSSSSDIAVQDGTAASAHESDVAAPIAPSAAANEASQALATVQADLNVPILPDQVVPPAHDVASETAAEEESSEIIVDIEVPTTQNVEEALSNPENTGPTSASPSQASRQIDAVVEQQQQLDGAAIPPAPTPADIGIPSSSSHFAPLPVAPPAEALQPVQPSLADISLPDGLTASSPSVLANRELLHAYSENPTNPMILLSLFNWAVQKTEIVDARVWYEVFAAENPTAVQPLLALINLDLALSNFAQVEALFARGLKGQAGGSAAAADVSIWSAYLHYIRRQNPITDGATGDAARSTITKAYEFALKECGFDRESGEIWEEYLKFVADTPTKSAWETQTHSDNLRKLYQRAVCIPLNNIESLWKAYDAFESNLNKATAKKFLAERSPAYMTARTALREMRGLTDSLPRPILPPFPSFSDDDRRMVNGWKAYLKWEEGNPLVIEDQEALSARIGYALRRCLSEMRHFPELWHYTANYYIKAGKKDEATEILKSGAQACPKSFLLTFALAEAEEERKNYSDCHAIFTALLARLSPDIDELRKTIETEVEAARGPEIPGAAGDATDDIDMTGEVSEVQRLVEEREARGKHVAEVRGKDVEDLQVGVSVVWIMYMRFARRAEGSKGARGVFGKARKSPHLTWHVFEASAMMEYHANKDSSVAIRIFELGFKLFADDVDYVIRYLQFLLNINDDTNARALFERSAAKIPSDRARPLWDTWARYEYVYGDLAGVHKLEQRFAEAFPNDSPLKRFAQRYTYNGIDEIALRDLGFGRMNRPAPAPAAFPPAGGLAAPFAPQAAPMPITNSTPSMIPPAPAPIGQGSSNSPAGYKRSAPDSPRAARRPSVDHAARSPKRYRANSPPAGGRRFPERERDRDRVGSASLGGGGRYPPSISNGHGQGHGHGRDRSPIAHQPPAHAHGHGHGRNDRSSLTPVGGAAYGAPPPSSLAPDRDRSGVGKPLAWFVGSLPSARSFDGPIFRPEDIIGLFNNISATGAGYGSAPPPVPVPVPGPGPGYGPPPSARPGGYPEPDRRYGAPPMRGGRY